MCLSKTLLMVNALNGLVRMGLKGRQLKLSKFENCYVLLTHILYAQAFLSQTPYLQPAYRKPGRLDA